MRVLVNEEWKRKERREVKGETYEGGGGVDQGGGELSMTVRGIGEKQEGVAGGFRVGRKRREKSERGSKKTIV